MQQNSENKFHDWNSLIIEKENSGYHKKNFVIKSDYGLSYLSFVIPFLPVSL
jgi:hypothetical protein